MYLNEDDINYVNLSVEFHALLLCLSCSMKNANKETAFFILVH